MPNLKRTQITLLLAVLLLSSVTMIWLFRRFPVPTSIVTIVVLGMLFHCAQVARPFDPDAPTRDGGKQ
jgi:hypothetical protein